jgi:hypothetical protein
LLMAFVEAASDRFGGMRSGGMDWLRNNRCVCRKGKWRKRWLEFPQS